MNRHHSLLLSVAPRLLTLRVALAQEPARSCNDFVDSVGVCTHWSYPDTPYGYAYDKVKQLLGEMNIRHIRDGFHPREADLFHTYGIKSTTIFGPGNQAPADQIKALGDNVAEIAMIEGPNEVDIFPRSAAYKGLVFPEGPRAYQNDLYAAVKANPATASVGVIAPSTARNGSNLKLAPLASFDYLVMHSYAGGGMPSASLESRDVNNLRNATGLMGLHSLLKPVVATECGYHTALGNTGTAQPGVSEKAQAKYIIRTFTEYFNRGVAREFTYEFIDEFPDYQTSQSEATNAEACFGLVRRNLTPKPAYYAERNLLTLLKDAAWNPGTLQWEAKPFAPTALGFSLAGSIQNVHHTLLQKSNGDFYLLLWQEVPSFDTKAKQDIVNAPVPVTVSFDGPITSADVYLPGAGPELRQHFPTTRSLSLSVPDEVLAVCITPAARLDHMAPAAPTNLTATTAATSATLQWSPARNAKGLGGYFVWRLGRFLGRTTRPAFTDRDLQPGVGYTYTVRAFDDARNMSAPATVVAATPAIFPDLVVTDLTWTPANPRAGDAVSFTATIKNQGTSDSPAGVVHGVAFHIDGAIVNWSDNLKDSLAPGATRILTANNGPKGAATWSATAGHHTITAIVDDLNRIAESQETNNELPKAIDVAGP